MNPKRLDGKNALVTGGCGGLGRHVARAFLAEGAVVAVTYKRLDEFKQLQEELGEDGKELIGFQVDAANEESVRKMVAKAAAKLGSIDVLANLIGGFDGGKQVAETEEKLWDAMMQVNLKTAFLCSKHVLREMTRGKGGAIVSVSSRAAVRRTPRMAAYSIAKAGVAALTEFIAEEYKDAGVRANCVLPGMIDTPANRAAFPNADFGKWVKPQDVAEVIVFLAGDASKDVSGAGVPVYGRA